MFVLAKICNLVNLICNEIYPSDLEIVMTNDDNKFTTFLDLEISINNTLFDTKPYDIRRDFKFQVVSSQYSVCLILGIIYLRNKRMVYSKENYL